jgi:uncharacterized membrane protein
MKNSNKLINTAISSVIALGAAASSGQAMAAPPPMEKCYGIVKAGKNDCQTSTTACAGTATKDAQGDAWIYIPKGTCEKIVGGSLTSKTK